MIGAAGTALVIAWTLFAFGAVYPWVSRPAAAASLVLFLYCRPSLFRDSTFAVDAALAALLGYVWLQWVPMPPALVDALSPANAATHRAIGLVFDPAAWRPLSMAPGATWDAAAILTGAVALYWVVRETAGQAGLRLIVRSLAACAILAVVVAVTRPFLFPNGKMYGIWQPIYAEANPLGPIVSRNHFASWMVTAAPAVMGYLFAHGAIHWTVGSRRGFLVRMLTDTRALWLVTAAGLMAAGVVFSHSRAGLIGLSAAMLLHLTTTWRSAGRQARGLLLVGAAGMAGAAWLLADPAVVLHRLSQAQATDWGGRTVIWRTTLDMARDFPLTGVGLGAFEGTAPLYQPRPLVVLFNHAHSQYLQWWSEGGWIGAAIALWLAMAGLSVFVSRQRRDTSPMAHLRFGALAGVIGLAVQAVWESPFVTPAVLWLAAVVAGIAMSRPPVASDTGSAH